MTRQAERVVWPERLNQRDLAGVMGVSQATISDMTIAGAITREADGSYRITAIAQAFLHQRKTMREGGSGMGLAAERTEYTREKTAMARLDRLEREGALVPEDEVEEAYELSLMPIRTRLLALPARLAARLIACRTAADVQRVLKKVVDEILSEISSLKWSNPARGHHRGGGLGGDDGDLAPGDRPYLGSHLPEAGTTA